MPVPPRPGLREPFRLFFPLAILLGIVGVAPWLLFWHQSVLVWPGGFHAQVMTQAFVLAAAVGFLGTMIPRKLQAPPMTAGEAATIAAALVALPVVLATGHAVAPAVAQLAYVLSFGGTAAFLLRRRRRGASQGALPPSFLFIPLSIGLGLTGAILWALASLVPDLPPWLGFLGSQMTYQGPLLGLVMAIAPMLVPVIVAPSGPPSAPGPRFQAAVAVAFAASFPVEAFLGPWGLLLRGLACGAALYALCPPWARRAKAGLHRGLFRLALGLIPVGLVSAALIPERRVALLHVTFVAGLYLVIVAVSAHVVMLHTGRDRLADGRPWPLAAAAALALGAAVVRVLADRFWQHYFLLLALASVLWLLSAAAWGFFVVKLCYRQPSVPSSP
jgi:uncharacterized protein involved in response to NO